MSMELLGIGPLELLVIALIALIIFSPKDIAKGGKTVGHWINQLNKSDAWKSMRQVSQEMQNLPSRLAREAQLEELDELKKGIGLEIESPPPAGKDSGKKAASTAAEPGKDVPGGGSPKAASSPANPMPPAGVSESAKQKAPSAPVAPAAEDPAVPNPYGPASPPAKGPK
jgi:Sec-independent protein translocase protein TatA